MPELLVQIDGETLPLTKCYWIQTAACGCIVSMATTVTPSRVLATADDAHKHLVPLKRDRAKDVRDGYTWSLIRGARYHAEIGTKWECEQHRKAAAS